MKDSTKIIATFIITISIFISGFLIGNISLDYKVDILNDLQSDLYTTSLGFDTLSELANENICDESSIYELNSILTEFGEKITYLEKENIDLNNLKNQYYALEIKHYLIINKINKECGKKYDTLLYFYGDYDECILCEIQGNELTKMKNEKNKLMIYSFDYKSDFPPVKNLVLKSNIKELPHIIINNNEYNYLNFNELKLLFDTQ